MSHHFNEHLNEPIFSSRGIFENRLDVGANLLFIQNWLLLVLVYVLVIVFHCSICTLELEPSQDVRGGPWLILPLPSSSSDNPLEGKFQL